MNPLGVSRLTQRGSDLPSEQDEGLQRRQETVGPAGGEMTSQRSLAAAGDHSLLAASAKEEVDAALVRAEFQLGVLGGLHQLAVKMRALAISSCNDGGKTDRDRGLLQHGFYALLGEFNRFGELAARDEEEVFSGAAPLLGGGPDASHAQSCADKLEPALAGVSQACASLASLSVAHVMEAKQAQENLDEFLETLAEICASLGSVWSVLSRRSTFLMNATRQCAHVAGSPPAPAVGLPIAALARPRQHR